ncbi:hypothetical protein Tco_0695886 [Tanacetum coccineum]
MAATGAACQALWLKRLLSELTGWEEKRITLKVDNISAIALVRNPVFHGRSKHIDIRYHFIRECVENGHINVEHVSGELQRADILTKALPRLKFYISSKAPRIPVVCVVVKGDGGNCGGDGFGDDGGVNGSYHQRRFPVMQGGDDERLRWFLYVLLRNTSEVGWDVNRSEY